MKLAKNIKYIVIHCTAGYGSINSIIKFWKQSLGWRDHGYDIIIDLDGTIWYNTGIGYSKNVKHARFELTTNGVRGYNDTAIDIAYIGGVKKDNYSVAKDTRTNEQLISIPAAIQSVLNWLNSEGVNIQENLKGIIGHRDFSKDKNDSGIIESWERIKECPSFDAIPEYSWILNKEPELPNT